MEIRHGTAQREFKDHRRECWSDNASLWAEYIDTQRSRSDLFGHLVTRIRKKFRKKTRLRVLDLGCGEGRLLRILHDKFPDAELVGVDDCPKMVELARKRSAMMPVHLLEADFEAEHLPVEGTFDVVTAVLSLIEVENLDQALRHIGHRLADGGLAATVILDPTVDMMRLYSGGLVDGKVESQSRDQEWLLLSSRFRVMKQLSPRPYFRFVRPVTVYAEAARQAGLEQVGEIETVKDNPPAATAGPAAMFQIMYFKRQENN